LQTAKKCCIFADANKKNVLFTSGIMGHLVNLYYKPYSMGVRPPPGNISRRQDSVSNEKRLCAANKIDFQTKKDFVPPTKPIFK
jgi:hypothetical protein